MAQSNMNFLPNDLTLHTEEIVLLQNSSGRQDSVSESLFPSADKVKFNLVQLDQEDRRNYFKYITDMPGNQIVEEEGYLTESNDYDVEFSLLRENFSPSHGHSSSR